MQNFRCIALASVQEPQLRPGFAKHHEDTRKRTMCPGSNETVTGLHVLARLPEVLTSELN